MSEETKQEGEVKEEAAAAQSEEVTLSPDEATAKESGWKPKDEWVKDGGSEEDWKPAKVFNEIGTLKSRLIEKEKEAKKLNKVVTLMKEHHMQVRETAVQEALKQLRAQRHAALTEENFAKAEVLRDRMDDLKESATKGTALPAEIEKEIKETTEAGPPPSFYKFVDRNPWYKANTEDTMTKKADALGLAYATANPKWTYEEILETVEKDIKQLYPDKFEKPRGGPNDSGNRGSGGGSASKKYNLDENQLAMAKAFDMTPEAYAKELESYKGR